MEMFQAEATDHITEMDIPMEIILTTGLVPMVCMEIHQMPTIPMLTPGTKMPRLTVYSNGQSAVANCSVSVGGVGQLSSGVYLTQVPYTGVDFNLKLVLFLIGITLWSAFAAYMIIRKRNSLIYANGAKTDMTDRLEEFKKENLKNKTGN